MSGPGSSPSRDALEARAILTALLEAAYGSMHDARVAIERALREANRLAFPTSVPDVLTFVRTGLLPVLSEDLGPRLTMTLMEDFIAAHEIRSGVRARESVAPAPRELRSTRPRGLRVLLVDTDRFGRVTLARALARESCQVNIVDSLDELGQVIRGTEGLDVAVFDGQHPAKLLLMEVIVDRFPDVALVVRSTGEDATRTLLQALGVARFDVLPGAAAPDALVAAVLAHRPR